MRYFDPLKPFSLPGPDARRYLHSPLPFPTEGIEHGQYGVLMPPEPWEHRLPGHSHNDTVKDMPIINYNWFSKI